MEFVYVLPTFNHISSQIFLVGYLRLGLQSSLKVLKAEFPHTYLKTTQ